MFFFSRFQIELFYHMIFLFMYDAVRPALVPLWISLSWWIIILYRAGGFNEGTASSWLNSFVMSLLVGIVLNVNAFASQQTQSVLTWLLERPFSVFRFFAIPFCVSSYAAAVQREKEQFVIVFPVRTEVLVLGLSSSCAVGIAAFAFRWMLRCYVDERRPIINNGEEQVED